MKKNTLLQIAFSLSSFILKLKKLIPLCLLLILSQTGHTQSSWLESSWGVTYPVFGGTRMDSEIETNNYDYVAGSKEIADELPTVGHIITNLTNFAKSDHFTLSANANVDVVNEIHASIVPNTANDEVIFDVLQNFKNSGKKVILYISTNYFERASDEVQAAWLAYYTNNFDGNEYAAYENLIEGFIENVKDYADGYWLDTVYKLADDGQIDNFAAMLRATDPGCLIGINQGGGYFKNTDGSNIEVASDGINDSDSTPYKIVKHKTNTGDSDFTSGHVTPIGQGAPVNSWGYEEFTIPEMIANPWAPLNGKHCLSHGWFPTRERWHSANLPLVFDLEQAYRFVRRITDGGTAITFASTTDGNVNPGHMMPDEMVIMKEINRRLLMTPMMDYVPYTRPECAYLVGETPPCDETTIGNLALNGTATQSGTANGAEASRAIDDNTNGSFGAGSVTASAAASEGAYPWWEVDLGDDFNIDNINIFNRTNCCSERLNDITVYIIDSNGVETFKQKITSDSAVSLTIDPIGVIGKIIRIESNQTVTMNLAEVQVFGSAITLGIETENKSDRLVIYPNPVSDIITINYNNSITAKMEIIDYLGKTILSNNINKGINTFDFSTLSSGLYIIKVYDEFETFTRKIIKN
ncbi:T9SS type A sorting domain-containing protein [Formosa sp. PL04]|uniref:T9SS type A sorting domain-containing protein n=1 Tax=Formosa sp. PL04 TaxID=3081755 RepID=UPI002980A7D5|nr:T9SS type A sorting domain-containing protein [Formosa sp. PL04]MDW5290824.1 T9SS type A sorting domain-containing protein [Formosa sp. PL04]